MKLRVRDFTGWRDYSVLPGLVGPFQSDRARDTGPSLIVVLPSGVSCALPELRRIGDSPEPALRPVPQMLFNPRNQFRRDLRLPA